PAPLPPSTMMTSTPRSLAGRRHSRARGSCCASLSTGRTIDSFIELCPHPRVIARDPRQQAVRCMCATPFSGRIFVSFHEGWIDVDGAQHLGEPQAVLHGENEFRQQIPRMLAHDGDAQDPVLSGYCE